jgi:hypothetical protein
VTTSQQLILSSGGPPPGPPHVDPASWTWQQLAAIRGAMWTARANLPMGPRPNQDSNILNIGGVAAYLNAGIDPDRVFAPYVARGYTHADVGPLPMGEGGYHRQYPDTVDYRQNPDAFCDILQMYWDRGIAPVWFAKPDNWTVADLDNRGLTSIYSSPRFRKLVRIVVDRGWEPSQDDSNRTYVEGYEWGWRVFPDALHCIHMTADFDAPGNNEDLTPGQPGYIGNAGCWYNVVPYLHLWLVQNYGYIGGGDQIPTPTFIRNFGDQFDADVRGSLANRFERGYAGWPTFSAWGQGVGLKCIAGEFAATADYHWNWPEEEARKLGDIAMARGAWGSLDGCFAGRY